MISVIPLVVYQLPEVADKTGRPRTKPEDVYADAGYDSDSTRAILSWLGMAPNIRRQRNQHGSGLGKVCRVAERSISWIKGLRSLRVRCDRQATIIEAWATLAMSVINFRI